MLNRISLLPIFIHLLIVLLILPTRYILHPSLVRQVPFHGFFDAFFELQARFPAQFAFQLRRVDSIAEVMSLAVGYISNEVEGIAFRVSQEAVHRLDDDLDQVDVFPFVEAADVVRVGHFAFMENQVDGAGMVFHIEPVADVLAFSIDRKGLAVADVVDEQRYQFFGKLVGTVVVRAVRHDGRHSVGVVEGADEMVAAGFTCGIRAVRVVFCLLREQRAVELQCAINFVR